jgi:hypothetical protein
MFDGDIICPNCGEERYITRENSLVSVRQVKILPIGQQLATLVYHRNTRAQLFGYGNMDSNPPGVFKDVFDGAKFKTIARSRYDIFFGLYIDGFTSKNKSSQSLGLVQFLVYNFSPSNRCKSTWIFKYTIFPGPLHVRNKYICSFLAPLYDELKSLAENGMTLLCDDGIRRTCKVYALFFTGDIPAVSPLAGHAGHNSIRPCRICEVVYVLPDATDPENVIPKHLPILQSASIRSAQDFYTGNEAVSVND